MNSSEVNPSEMNPNEMNNIHCVKLNKQGVALKRAPWPGALGERIQNSICQEAWKLWLGEQTILINENSYSPINPEHKAILQQQMVAFLFAE